MTDTTAIKALREAALKATPGPWVTVDYFWIAQEKDGHGGEFIVFDNGPDAAYVRNLSPDRILALLDQLEAERQRADDAHKYGSERDSENESLMHTVGRLRVEIAELKGEQVPVAWPDMPFTFEELEQMHGATFANGYVRGWARKCESVTMKGPLFTSPQKPVVVTRPPMDDIYHNKLSVWVDGFNYASKGYDANIEAAGGIVKDGE